MSEWEGTWWSVLPYDLRRMIGRYLYPFSEKLILPSAEDARPLPTIVHSANREDVRMGEVFKRYLEVSLKDPTASLARLLKPDFQVEPNLEEKGEHLTNWVYSPKPLSEQFNLILSLGFTVAFDRWLGEFQAWAQANPTEIIPIYYRQSRQEIYEDVTHRFFYSIINAFRISDEVALHLIKMIPEQVATFRWSEMLTGRPIRQIYQLILNQGGRNAEPIPPHCGDLFLASHPEVTVEEMLMFLSSEYLLQNLEVIPELLSRVTYTGFTPNRHFYSRWRQILHRLEGVDPKEGQRIPTSSQAELQVLISAELQVLISAELQVPISAELQVPISAELQVLEFFDRVGPHSAKDLFRLINRPDSSSPRSPARGYTEKGWHRRYDYVRSWALWEPYYLRLLQGPVPLGFYQHLSQLPPSTLVLLRPHLQVAISSGRLRPTRWMKSNL